MGAEQSSESPPALNPPPENPGYDDNNLNQTRVLVHGKSERVLGPDVGRTVYGQDSEARIERQAIEGSLNLMQDINKWEKTVITSAKFREDSKTLLIEAEEQKKPRILSLQWIQDKLKEQFLPDSQVLDVTTLPFYTMLQTIFSFWGVFLVLAAFFASQTYITDRTSTFMSLDPTSGDCVEVPKFISGTFYGDSHGFWSSNGRFKFNRAMYAIDASSFSVTQEQWTTALTGAFNKLRDISAKSTSRDLAWNLVAFNSYTAKITGPVNVINGVSYSGGVIRVYAAASPEIIYGTRSIQSAFVASASGACSYSPSSGLGGVSAVFDEGSKSFVIRSKVCSYGPCLAGHNPCSQFDPSQFGYKWGRTTSEYLDFKIDSRSLSLAMAVNMGIMSINDLDMVEVDDEMDSFMRQLINARVISPSDGQAIWPFYDHKSVPMDPIYCMIYPKDLSLDPFSKDIPSFNAADDDATLFGVSNVKGLYLSGSPLNFVGVVFSQVIHGPILADYIASGSQSNDRAVEHALLGMMSGLGFKDDVDFTDLRVFQVNSYSRRRRQLQQGSDDHGNSNTTRNLAGGNSCQLYDSNTNQPYNPPNLHCNCNNGDFVDAIQPYFGMIYKLPSPDFYGELYNLANKLYSKIADKTFERALTQSNGYFQTLSNMCGSPPTTYPMIVSGDDFSFVAYFNPNAQPAPQGFSENYYRYYTDDKEVTDDDKVPTPSQAPSPRPTNPPDPSSPGAPPSDANLSPPPPNVRYRKLEASVFSSQDALVTPSRSNMLRAQIESYANENEILVSPFFADFFRDLSDNLERGKKLNDAKRQNVEFHAEGGYMSGQGLSDEDEMWYQEINESGETARRLTKTFVPKPTVEKGSQAVCYLRVSTTLIYPVTSHYGMRGQSNSRQAVNGDTSIFNHLPAKCMGPHDHATVPPSKRYCEFFDVLIGLIFYPQITDPITKKVIPDGRIFALGKLGLTARQQDLTNGDLYMSNASYNAMSVMVSLGQSVPHSPAHGLSVPIRSQLYATAFRELCGVSACSMITLELFDHAKQPSFNAFNYRPPASPSFSNQIYNGNATTSLLTNYPTALIEPYFVCVKTKQAAAIDAVANGKANADVYAAVALTLFLWYLVGWFKLRGVKIKTKKDREKEQEILKEEKNRLVIDSLRAISITLRSLNGSIEPTSMTAEIDKRIGHVGRIIDGIDAITEGRVDVKVTEVEKVEDVGNLPEAEKVVEPEIDVEMQRPPAQENSTSEVSQINLPTPGQYPFPPRPLPPPPTPPPTPPPVLPPTPPATQSQLPTPSPANPTTATVTETATTATTAAADKAPKKPPPIFAKKPPSGQ